MWLNVSHISNISTMDCPFVRGYNPRALASVLSYVQVDKHGLTILYHLRECITCISRGKGVIKIYSYTKHLFYVSIEYIPFKYTESFIIVVTVRIHVCVWVYRQTNRCINAFKTISFCI